LSLHCCCPHRTLPLLLPSPATASTALHPLSLHDALPICRPGPTILKSRNRKPPDRARLPGNWCAWPPSSPPAYRSSGVTPPYRQDRKSTRLNSSHVKISYAVFCLKKKRSLVMSPRRIWIV